MSECVEFNVPLDIEQGHFVQPIIWATVLTKQIYYNQDKHKKLNVTNPNKPCSYDIRSGKGLGFLTKSYSSQSQHVAVLICNHHQKYLYILLHLCKCGQLCYTKAQFQICTFQQALSTLKTKKSVNLSH